MRCARRGNVVSHVMGGKRDHVHIAFNHSHFIGAFYGTGLRNPIKLAAFLEQQGFGRVKVFGRCTFIQRLTTKSDDAGGETLDVKGFVRNAKGNFGAPSAIKSRRSKSWASSFVVSRFVGGKNTVPAANSFASFSYASSSLARKKSSGFFSGRSHPSPVFPSAAIAPRCVNRDKALIPVVTRRWLGVSSLMSDQICAEQRCGRLTFEQITDWLPFCTDRSMLPCPLCWRDELWLPS